MAPCLAGVHATVGMGHAQHSRHACPARLAGSRHPGAAVLQACHAASPRRAGKGAGWCCTHPQTACPRSRPLALGCGQPQPWGPSRMSGPSAHRPWWPPPRRTLRAWRVAGRWEGEPAVKALGGAGRAGMVAALPRRSVALVWCCTHRQWAAMGAAHSTAVCLQGKAFLRAR